MMGSPVGLAVFDLSGNIGRAARELAGRLPLFGLEPRLITHKLPPEDLTAPDGRLLDAEKVAAWPLPESLRISSFDKNARRRLAERQVLVVHGYGDLTTQEILSVFKLERAFARRAPGAPPASAAVEALRKAQLAPSGARVIVAPSELAKRGLVEFYGVSAALVRVIPPGVDCRRYNPAIRGQSRFTLFRASGWTEHNKVILTLMPDDPARLNMSLLAQAVDILAQRLPAVLCVIGHVPAKIAAVEKLAGQSRYFNVPVTTHLENYLAAADAYVLPAVYDEFGPAVLESLASGTPVVLGPETGVGEILSPGVDSERLDSLDKADALAAALEKAWAIPRENCRKTAESRTWEAHAEQMAKVYRELI